MQNIGSIDAINTLTRGECVIVEFNDGNQAVFEPYRHGFGYQIEGLRTFILMNKNGDIICKVNVRLYYAGPQNDENKIVSIIAGMTQQKVAEYWEMARQFISSKFYPKGRDNYEIKDDKYWYHERVLNEGYFSLQRLKEGKMEIIET